MFAPKSTASTNGSGGTRSKCAIDTAIEAMRRGAWHYLVKPARLDEIALHAARAYEHHTLRRVNRQLRDDRRDPSIAKQVGGAFCIGDLERGAAIVAKSNSAR